MVTKPTEGRPLNLRLETLIDSDFDPSRLDILAANWVVVRHLDAGFRRRICPMMLVRINFGVRVQIVSISTDSKISGFQDASRAHRYRVWVDVRSKDVIQPWLWTLISGGAQIGW